MNYYNIILQFIIIRISLSIYIILNKSSFPSIDYKKLSNDLIYSFSYDKVYFLNKSLSITNSYENIFIDNYSSSEYFSPELNYIFIVCTKDYFIKIINIKGETIFKKAYNEIELPFNLFKKLKCSIIYKDYYINILLPTYDNQRDIIYLNLYIYYFNIQKNLLSFYNKSDPLVINDVLNTDNKIISINILSVYYTNYYFYIYCNDSNIEYIKKGLIMENVFLTQEFNKICKRSFELYKSIYLFCFTYQITNDNNIIKNAVEFSPVIGSFSYLIENNIKNFDFIEFDFIPHIEYIVFVFYKDNYIYIKILDYFMNNYMLVRFEIDEKIKIKKIKVFSFEINYYIVYILDDNSSSDNEDEENSSSDIDNNNEKNKYWKYFSYQPIQCKNYSNFIHLNDIIYSRYLISDEYNISQITNGIKINTTNNYKFENDVNDSNIINYKNINFENKILFNFSLFLLNSSKITFENEYIYYIDNCILNITICHDFCERCDVYSSDNNKTLCTKCSKNYASIKNGDESQCYNIYDKIYKHFYNESSNYFELCSNYLNGCTSCIKENGELFCIECEKNYVLGINYKCYKNLCLNDIENNNENKYLFYINENNNFICINDSQCNNIYNKYNYFIKENNQCVSNCDNLNLKYYNFSCLSCDLDKEYQNFTDCFPKKEEEENNINIDKIIAENNLNISENSKITISKYPQNSSTITKLDLFDCEGILREHYNLTENLYLILIKTNDENFPTEKVEYIVCDSNGNKLNLSICDSIKIDITYSITNDDKANINMAQKLLEDNIDIYNINDSFYNDVCNNKNVGDNDITLEDRKNDIFVNLCYEENCFYKSFNYSNNAVVCSCGVSNNNNNETIDEISTNNFLKYLNDKINYKIIKCYKYIFKKSTYKNNLGFFVTAPLIFLLIVLFFIFCFYDLKKLFILTKKKIKLNQIKVSRTVEYEKKEKKKIKFTILNPEINKNLFSTQIINKKNNLFNDENFYFINKTENTTHKKEKKIYNKNGSFILKNIVKVKPKKKKKNSNKNNEITPKKNNSDNSIDNNNNNDNKRTANIFKEEINNENILSENSLEINKNIFNESKIKDNSYDFLNLSEFNINNIISNKKMINNNYLDNESTNKKDLKKNDSFNNSNIFNKKMNKNNKNKSINSLKNHVKISFSDIKDYDEMIFKNAIYFDRRSFTEIIIHTFTYKIEILHILCFRRKYDLITLHLSTYIFSILIDFTINALLFSDDMISRKYKNGGKIELYSRITLSIGSNVLTLIIMGFIMIFTSYYNTLNLVIIEMTHSKQKLKLFNKYCQSMKRKFFVYFFIEFIFLIFVFYYVTLFCAIYHHSQVTIYKNYIVGLCMSFIYSFFFILIIAIFRVVALKTRKKNLYYVSQFLYIKA